MQREKRFPLGCELRIEDLAVDPYPLLARLREREPVSWAPQIGMWLVTRYEDVVTVLRDPETYTTVSEDSPIQSTFGRQMLSCDGPEHRRYKTFAMESFTVPALARDLEGPVAERVADRLAGWSAGSGPVELVGGLAAPVALESVCLVLGLPTEDVERLRAWYADFAQALANFARDPAVAGRGRGAAEEFRSYLRGRLRIAREQGGSGLLRRFADPDVCPWEPEEIFANVMIILFGGIETTESMIANALWALLTHPEQLARARADRGCLERAIEESMRWEPAVQSCTRFAKRPTRLHGVSVAAGEVVQCMLGAANRDPRRFRDPDRYDPDRADVDAHLAFGLGRHFCLGAHLARIEARCTLWALLRQFPDLRASRLASPYGYEFRKPPELWVEIGKAASA